MRETVPTQDRQQVETRAGGYCEYCKISVKYGVQSFECEHIKPLALGGGSTLDNLAFSCGGCNRCKSARVSGLDPDSGQNVALYNPREQKWHDHFAWNEDFTLVIGLTAIGRATVKTLQLNRPGLINLRRVLILVNEHPPQEK